MIYFSIFCIGAGISCGILMIYGLKSFPTSKRESDRIISGIEWKRLEDEKWVNSLIENIPDQLEEI